MARTRKNSDEQPIRIAAEGPFSFDGDCTSLQLACQATRVDLAFLCNPMMAVHAFNVETPPHQITAAYQSMPPRRPSDLSSLTTRAAATVPVARSPMTPKAQQQQGRILERR